MDRGKLRFCVRMEQKEHVALCLDGFSLALPESLIMTGGSRVCACLLCARVPRVCGSAVCVLFVCAALALVGLGQWSAAWSVCTSPDEMTHPPLLARPGNGGHTDELLDGGRHR